MALVSLLKCWPGIFCLCNQRNLGMTSLLNMLPLAKSDVQREILDVLYGVFQLKVPEWTSSFSEAVASIGEYTEYVCGMYLAGRAEPQSGHDICILHV